MNLSTPAKVGIVTVIALVCLMGIITWKTDFFLKSSGYQMTGIFMDIQGLDVGAEVRYRGFSIGKIMRIDPGPEAVTVYSTIKKEIKFPEDSILRVAFDGIVGSKFLEVVPGHAKDYYRAGNVLRGISGASVADFIDIGTQNLQELKAILTQIKNFVEDPKIYGSFEEAVINTRTITVQLKALIAGINKIAADPNFQKNFKNIATETNKTLTSANNFFSGISSLSFKPEGEIAIGTTANMVRGSLDIGFAEDDYLRFGIGEGPTRDLSILDVLIGMRINDMWAYRLGMINTQLGGGIDYYPERTKDLIVSADLYDFNNPRPALPKIRLGLERHFIGYVNWLVQGDDVLNGADSNFMLGIRVKEPAN